MGHVEPEGYEADDVYNGSPDFLEGHLQEEGAHSGGAGDAVKLGQHGEVVVQHFLELHLGPELDKVYGEESEDHDAEDEHVFRGPFHLGLACGDLVAVVAACGAVLDREPQGVDDVDDEQQCETGRSDERIPVRSEEFTHLVVGGGPQEGDGIHQHVKSNE